MPRFGFVIFIVSGVGASTALAANESAMRYNGNGAQVYVCSATSGKFAWTLKAPDAKLTDENPKQTIKHFAGPTWQAMDGSSVVGEAVATSPSPRLGAIPWLVLRAKSHSGSGMLSDVAYIVRTDTRGGVAPRSGCDQAHSASERRVSYSATYLFFPAEVQK
jgi:Protein of unknown function (DUF3455)